MTERPVKVYPTIGCCGIDCGLCPRYYTAGDSRCPGCAGSDFYEKHPTCGMITCCVKNKGLEVCGQCDEYPCARLKGWGDGDSFVTHQTAHSNSVFIKEHGLERFIEQQNRRIKLLETMIKQFDDGRSKSFYCLAASLLTIEDLEQAFEASKEKIKTDIKDPDDIKAKADILKEFLRDCADRKGIALRLRRGK
jgi:hypothetical protein